MADGTQIYGLTTIDTKLTSSVGVINATITFGNKTIVFGPADVKFDNGQFGIYGNEFAEILNTGDTGAIVMNYRGLNYGYTKFRDFAIADGKANYLFRLDGSTKALVQPTPNSAPSLATLYSSTTCFYVDEVTCELKGVVQFSNGTTGLCTLCSITT